METESQHKTKAIQPTYEAVNTSAGSSIVSLKFAKNQNIKSNFWHFHPEIELVYVYRGSGKRQIGSSISYFNQGDLVLIGSNLPHCGLTNENTLNEYEIVIQFKPDFLGSGFWETPEMYYLVQLLEKAKSGIAFGNTAKKDLKKEINQLHQAQSVEKVTKLLGILDYLSKTEDYKILNAEKFQFQTHLEDHNRINLLFNYVKDNFKNTITLEEVANLANMTVPSFCRYFRKTTNRTFTQFVNEYRIVHAMKLLVEKEISITEVCYESGFQNFGYFNRTFKAYTKLSPSQYRNDFRKLLK